MTKFNRITSFLQNRSDKSYTSESLAKILHLNGETTRKYLREIFYMGSATRFSRDGAIRYQAILGN